ncbi:MAG: hypothetical protein ACYDBQ_00065 [Thermoplasmatota archaeon]
MESRNRILLLLGCAAPWVATGALWAAVQVARWASPTGAVEPPPWLALPIRIVVVAGWGLLVGLGSLSVPGRIRLAIGASLASGLLFFGVMTTAIYLTPDGPAYCYPEGHPEVHEPCLWVAVPTNHEVAAASARAGAVLSLVVAALSAGVAQIAARVQGGAPPPGT